MTKLVAGTEDTDQSQGKLNPAETEEEEVRNGSRKDDEGDTVHTSGLDP